MPIEYKKKTAAKADETAPEAKGLTLFNEDGELILPGEGVADFLDTCDFTSVAESKDAQPFLVLAEEGDDEEGGEDDDDAEGDDADGDDAAEEPEADADADDEEGDGEEADADAAEETVSVYIPGHVAARLVDEDDLVEMFGFYLDRTEEAIEASDKPMLQERAVIACFKPYRDAENGGIAEDKVTEVAALLRSVIEGSDIAAEVSEKFLTKGARMKVSRIRKKPKTGKKKRMLKKRRREEGRGAKKAKIQRQKKMFKRKRASRIKMLQRESAEGTAEDLLFGFGEGIDGAAFKVGVNETPDLAFEGDVLDALVEQCFTLTCGECDHEAPFAAFATDEADKGACPECDHAFDIDLDEKKKMPPAFLKKMKGKKGDKDKGDSDGDDDGSKKGEKYESKDKVPSGYIGGPFAASTGRPSLSEGHSLAGSVLATMGVGRKTLNEDED